VNDARGGSEAIRPDTLSVSFSASIANSRLEGSTSAASTVRALRNTAALLRGTLERLEETEVVCVDRNLVWDQADELLLCRVESYGNRG
jgi:hypothetical protein